MGLCRFGFDYTVGAEIQGKAQGEIRHKCGKTVLGQGDRQGSDKCLSGVRPKGGLQTGRVGSGQRKHERHIPLQKRRLHRIRQKPEGLSLKARYVAGGGFDEVGIVNVGGGGDAVLWNTHI